MLSTATSVPAPTADPSLGAGNWGTELFSTSGGFSGSPDLSGPWFIEYQTLNYDYLRVPIGSVSSMGIGLSSITLNGQIDKTILLVVANAEYHAVSSDSYYTSGYYQQPQQFQVQAVSSDANGQTYGSSLAAGAFGPRGKVITNQPWYSRRPYIAGRDTLQSQVCHGAMNFVAVSVSSNNGVAIPVILNAYQTLEDLMTPAHAHSWNTMMGAKGTLLGIEAQPQLGIKFGGYSINVDKVEDVQVMTDTIGNLIKLGHLTDGAGRPVDTWNHGNGMHNVIVSEYDVTQHNWT